MKRQEPKYPIPAKYQKKHTAISSHYINSYCSPFCSFFQAGILPAQCCRTELGKEKGADGALQLAIKPTEGDTNQMWTVTPHTERYCSLTGQPQHAKHLGASTHTTNTHLRAGSISKGAEWVNGNPLANYSSSQFFFLHLLAQKFGHQRGPQCSTCAINSFHQHHFTLSGVQSSG